MQELTTGLLWGVLLLQGITVVLVVRGRRKGDHIPLWREEVRLLREDSERRARELREELGRTQMQSHELLVGTLNTLGEQQKAQLGDVSRATREFTADSRQEMAGLSQRVSGALRDLQQDQQQQREAMVAAMNQLGERGRLDQEKARATLEQKLQQIQESNEKRLDEMRRTVDEKLHGALERRLGESFKLVSDRLEAVQRGLGEMKSLADGVGDLKRVLTNVKDRGTWGEYQLGAILDQVLTPDQYARNVRPWEGSETVEFAVKLPGRDADAGTPLWLPIDAKFPREDYERLLAAVECADAEAVKGSTAALANAVRKAARDIHDKYLHPPNTTDFAILFLPTEGLYAEILRHPGLHDELQSRHRVLAAGPTTLAAILNSLRIGFQTLAIEQRSHEVWNVLAGVKSEFGKFGEVLARLKRQLHTASNTIDQTEVRSRMMQRRLRQVAELPADQAQALLELPPEEPEEEEPEEVALSGRC
jgi:DNA recombination protein RmuC